MISCIDHIEVNTEDLEKSIAFYTDILGFTLTRRVRYEGSSGRQIAYVALGDQMLELLGPVQRRPDQGDPADGGRIGVRLFALRVDAMERTVDYLRSRGVEISSEPRPGGSFSGLRAEIRDPNGISIELREWQGDGPSNAAWQPQGPGVTRIA